MVSAAAAGIEVSGLKPNCAPMMIVVVVVVVSANLAPSAWWMS